MCIFSKSANTAKINIDSLGHEVRDFITKYEQGSKQASQLMSREALQVREVVVRHSGQTEEAIRAHVTKTSANIERKFEVQIEQASRAWLQEKLLQSLKYPGMNERANQIEAAHAHTFGWLFGDDGDLGYRNDEQGIKELRERLKALAHTSYSFGDTARYLDLNECIGVIQPRKMVWDSFTDWLQSDLSIYWVMGKPGSGKSTLAKFILSEPRTRAALRSSHPGVIIASHFFWRSGTLLQRNIKGMLSSIVYQLVISVPNALEHASAVIARLSQKDSHTDWSVAELQRLCLSLIRHCGKPLCLLVDGLDECGPEDDHQELLDTLDRIKSQGVKIIASSRSEPVFERRFRHEPQLRMQDLTAGDLLAYATNTLRHEIQNDVFFLADLIRNAEGVFLWLVLVVQSINRGFDNGESLTDLRKRMKGLPKRLNALYEDMWKRLNDDTDLFRRDAAIYFRLVLVNQESELQCNEYGFSTMEMMLASFEKTHGAFAKSPVISAIQFLEECERFRTRVVVRCAGLVSLDRPGSAGLDKENLEDTESKLLQYANKEVQFKIIHRSAHDFLVDTIEGQNILEHAGVSSEDLKLRILGASLRAAELLFLMLGQDGKLRAMQKHYPPQDVGVYLSDLAEITHGFSDSRDSASRELFSLCWEFSSGLLLDRRETQPTRIAAFFGVAANYPSLDCYSTSIIEKWLPGSDIRSAILLSVLVTCQETFSPEPRRGYFPDKLALRLLRLPGIDVNLKSPLLVSRPRTIPALHTLEDIGPLDHTMESSFTRLLGFALEHIYWKPLDKIKWRSKTAKYFRLVSEFVSQGADLRSTLFLACPDRRTKHRPRDTPDVPVVTRFRFHQFPGWDFCDWVRFKYDHDSILCVVALQATTVIRRLLANLFGPDLTTDSIKDGKWSPGESEWGSLDLESAIPFLSEKCQENDCGVDGRVIGFLQPYGNFADMPYRQVSDRDSAKLMEMIWACYFQLELGLNDMEIRCREVAARSPFSTIGFRDYLRDAGCFDELAAHELLLKHQEGM